MYMCVGVYIHIHILIHIYPTNQHEKDNSIEKYTKDLNGSLKTGIEMPHQCLKWCSTLLVITKVYIKTTV